MRPFRLLVHVLACINASMLAFPASATLGEAFLPEAAKHAISGVHLSSQGSYTISEYTLASGTVVKEFIASSNKVFAVVWRGASKPNLSQLFGQYYPRYMAAVTNQSAPRSRHFLLKDPDLVIQARGRMGRFSGVAYLPGEMPPDVGESNLR